MSLPKGYTELEYIESTGTQYIDTGFKPNRDTRIDLSAVAFSTDSAADGVGFIPYGSGVSYTSNAFECYTAEGQLEFNYANIYAFIGSAVAGSVYNISHNKNVVTVSGAVSGSYTFPYTSISPPYTMTLFALHRASILVGGAMRLYSCQIYDNGTLIRDFLPCINASGAVGLWDAVNGVFYSNSGSGVFTAGNVVLRKPDSPAGLDAVSKNGSVTFTWEESENAESYRVYKNGVLIADTKQAMLTVSSEPYSANIYSVTAYNDEGESDPAVIRVYTPGSSDVLDDLITDRTAADVATRTRKGVYNASDLNRVAAAAKYVHDILDGLGYRVPDQPNRAWFTNEIPDKNEIEAHHNAVVGLDVIRYAHEKVVLPPNLEKLTYERANNIEKFLLLCGEAAERIPAAYIYSDELYGGELS